MPNDYDNPSDMLPLGHPGVSGCHLYPTLQEHLSVVMEQKLCQTKIDTTKMSSYYDKKNGTGKTELRCIFQSIVGFECSTKSTSQPKTVSNTTSMYEKR